jgi:hypothetical protein
MNDRMNRRINHHSLSCSEWINTFASLLLLFSSSHHTC